jgi:hypothetical protein
MNYGALHRNVSTFKDLGLVSFESTPENTTHPRIEAIHVFLGLALPSPPSVTPPFPPQQRFLFLATDHTTHSPVPRTNG